MSTNDRCVHNPHPVLLMTFTQLSGQDDRPSTVLRASYYHQFTKVNGATPRALSKAKREWSAEDDDFDGSEKELGAGLSVLSEEPDRQENESTFPSHKCLKRQLTSAEPSEV